MRVVTSSVSPVFLVQVRQYFINYSNDLNNPPPPLTNIFFGIYVTFDKFTSKEIRIVFGTEEADI